MNLREDEHAWRDDTAFHEFGTPTVHLQGPDGQAFNAHVVGGRNGTAAQERREEATNAPAVLMFISDLDINPDCPPMKFTPDSARALANALLVAANQAECAQETGGRMVEAIMQPRARSWRAARERNRSA